MRKVVDLTYPIHEGMATFPSPWHPVVEITVLGRHGIEKRETRKIVLGTHTGTHCDAPRHFLPQGSTVDSLDLEKLIGPAVVADFSYAEPGRELGIADFEKCLPSEFPERIVMRFDWSRHWNTMQFFTDHPYISLDAAEWLVKNGLGLLAMDIPSPDSPKHGRGAPIDSPVHKVLLSGGVILVEYLCNLDQLHESLIELIVLPLKISHGDGSPARCVAVEFTE